MRSARTRVRGVVLIGRAVIALTFGGAIASGCGTDAVGIETCRTIETARCKQAPRCPDINLNSPVHRDSPQTDVEACVRFYHDACLHGLSTGDPGGPATQACVAAINEGDCNVVLHPETDIRCLWLNPAPDAGVDAPPDVTVDAADSATE
ncbi:MAG: hypothetical protein ABIP89_09910 [Polyangiaceae bacterium]